jgi:hypothetical protein
MTIKAFESVHCVKNGGHYVDQVEKLIFQKDFELNTGRNLSQLNFLSHVRITTVVVILIL